MTMHKILLLNGPNMDMLGIREPEAYGRDTLGTLETTVRMYAEKRGVELTCYQSNSEGKLIGKIHGAHGKYDGIVYNPGAHTHYSYALRDAVASIDVPVVEVHLSDINAREDFRRISVIAPACVARVKGLGIDGYFRAIDVLCDHGPLDCLGDDYEKRYDMDESVIVSGGQGGDSPSMTASLSRTLPHVGASMGEDCTKPYRAAVKSVDAGAESRRRQDLVRGECGHLGIGGLLVRDTSNIGWITAFDGVFDEERAHALVMTPESAVLHTDSRYSNALRTVAHRIGSTIEVNDERVSHAEFAHRAFGSEGEDEGDASVKLGIEDTITYAEFVKLVDAFGTDGLAPTSDVVLRLRAVKTEGELARMRAAQAVTDAAFAYIRGYMRPGMTEREVQLELEDFMLRHGGEGLAFRSIVACGANGADPHAVPGSTRLEAGQCVVMDFGARAFGYCSDMTRTVFLGAPDPDGDLVRAWEVLRRANETVEAALKPGVTGKEAHELAERVLEEGGFGGRMGHGLGHGVGIDVHELPVLSPRNDEPLVAGNVVTVEPGIYLPGQFGMRLEDFGVVTNDGYDVFTKSTHEMVVI